MEAKSKVELVRRLLEDATKAEGKKSIKIGDAAAAKERSEAAKEKRSFASVKPQDSEIKPKIERKITHGENILTFESPSVSAPRTKSKTELTYKEYISEEGALRQSERLEELKREQGQNDENAEVLGIPLPFRSIGERSSLTNLHNLLEQCPQPQPPLINKQLKTLQLNAEQALIMAEQVKKMKNGMERLQEIIKKFNCTEKFKQDIDFIVANVGPAIAKAEHLRREKALARADSDHVEK